MRARIVHVITRLDWAGSPDILRILCRDTADRCDITLIVGRTVSPTAKTQQFLEMMGDRVIVLPELRREINPLLDVIALAKLCVIFHRKRFDIVHTHTAKAGALGRIAAFLSGAPPAVHMPHGHNFYGYFGGFASRLIVLAERILGRITDRIVVFTEVEKRDYVLLRIKKPKDIRVVPSGLELSEIEAVSGEARIAIRKELGLGGCRVVGMVCRLEEIKAPLLFVRAAKAIADAISGVRFVVVGEGSLREEMEKTASELGLRDHIIFTGWRDDVLALISSFDILVLPSLNEAVGRVLLEAQALGVPVVATQVGGIPDVVKDGRTGILVPPNDPAALAGAVRELLTDEEKRKAFSSEGRTWVRERFSSREMSEAVYRIYDELLAK